MLSEKYAMMTFYLFITHIKLFLYFLASDPPWTPHLQCSFIQRSLIFFISRGRCQS